MFRCLIVLAILAASGAAMLPTQALGAEVVFPASYFSGRLPACDSAIGKRAALYAFQKADPATPAIVGLTIISTINPALPPWIRKMFAPGDLGPPSPGVRCTAQAISSDGTRMPVSYSFLPLSGDRILVGTTLAEHSTP